MNSIFVEGIFMFKKENTSDRSQQPKQCSLSRGKIMNTKTSTNVVEVDFSQLGKERRRRKLAKAAKQNSNPTPRLDW